MSSDLPGRVLALDVGRRRIGLAVSDPARATAQPLAVIQRVNREADLAAVQAAAMAQQAVLIVVGLPLRLDGSAGPEAQRAQSFGRRLGRRLGLPVEFVDEALSTVEAQEVLLSADLGRAKRRRVVDKLAAAVILRRYLDGQGEGS